MNTGHKPLRNPLNRPLSLPRLSREHYQGYAVVHWTLTMFDKAKGWLTPALHGQFRELMLHAAAREGLLCPSYCLMPDHLHLIWMGLRLDTDQLNGMAFLRTFSNQRCRPQSSNRKPTTSSCVNSGGSGMPSPASVFTLVPIQSVLNWWPGPKTGRSLVAIVPGYPKLNLFDGGYWPTF